MATILVCDDAMFMRQSLIQMLKPEGHEVVAEAGNGLECIEQYKLYKPDIVLMDITMPDMDGLTALKKLKEIDSDVKVIMVSAMGQMNMVIEAVESGAKDFVVKPFTQEKIIQCINRYVQSKGSRFNMAPFFYKYNRISMKNHADALILHTAN